MRVVVSPNKLDVGIIRGDGQVVATFDVERRPPEE